MTLSPSDATSGVLGTQYKIDSNPLQTYSTPFTLTTEGQHLVRYASQDNAGNTEVTNMRAVWIHDKDGADHDDHAQPGVPEREPAIVVNPVTATAAGDDGAGTSGVAETRCQMDGTAPTQFSDMAVCPSQRPRGDHGRHAHVLCGQQGRCGQRGDARQDGDVPDRRHAAVDDGRSHAVDAGRTERLVRLRRHARARRRHGPLYGRCRTTRCQLDGTPPPLNATYSDLPAVHASFLELRAQYVLEARGCTPSTWPAWTTRATGVREAIVFQIDRTGAGVDDGLASRSSRARRRSRSTWSAIDNLSGVATTTCATARRPGTARSDAYTTLLHAHDAGQHQASRPRPDRRPASPCGRPTRPAG